jgi:hypothetical protein
MAEIKALSLLSRLRLSIAGNKATAATHSDYTQDWAHDFMAALPPPEARS